MNRYICAAEFFFALSAFAQGFQGDTNNCAVDQPCFNRREWSGDKIYFEFTATCCWDVFNVRYPQDGGQKQVENRSGHFTLTNIQPNRVYKLSVQGCNRHVLGRSTCSAWTEAVVETVVTPPPPPRSAPGALGTMIGSLASGRSTPPVSPAPAPPPHPVSGGAPVPVCDAARTAAAQGSPNAASLAAQCRALGGDPTLSQEARDLAAAGQSSSLTDELIAALRRLQPEANRYGFDVGIAATGNQTLWGPGKQRMLESLTPLQQEGFRVASSLLLDRNRNAQLAAAGAAIAAADPQVAQARTAEPDARYWLGFDIASGIFGNRARGALGNTQTGPGSTRIRNDLSVPAQRGFDAAVRFHLSRH